MRLLLVRVAVGVSGPPAAVIVARGGLGLSQAGSKNLGTCHLSYSVKRGGDDNEC